MEAAMATKRTSTCLESYERRYRELAGQLADIGFIATGSGGASLQPVRERELWLSCRPAPTPRPLLPVDGKGGRQDGQPATQPGRGCPLQRMDRQRSPGTWSTGPDAQSYGKGPAAHARKDPCRASLRFNRKLRRTSSPTGSRAQLGPAEASNRTRRRYWAASSLAQNRSWGRRPTVSP